MKSNGPKSAVVAALCWALLPAAAARAENLAVANDGVPDLAPLGETIYQEGMPDANIVACVVCHGPNAEGVAQRGCRSSVSVTGPQHRQRWRGEL